MKETDGWVKIKKYTDDEGKPVCNPSCPYGPTTRCEYTMDQRPFKGRTRYPGSDCPVWHGESKGEWQPISTAPTDGTYFIVKAEHCTHKNIIHIVGRLEEDGFYCEDRSELSFNYSPILWAPLPQENNHE